jgi:hypothetical protein
MVRRHPDDFYWAVGGLGYGGEIQDLFQDEAALLGVITILWNHYEGQLRALFVQMLKTPRTSYAEAIWDRQPTHQAKRNLLAMAADHGKLSAKSKQILAVLIEETKAVADRRNDLLHGRYEVHGNTDQLFAVTKSPNSSKPPKRHKSTVKDLEKVIASIERLMQLRFLLAVQLFDASGKKRLEIQGLADQLRAEGKISPLENPRSDSPPPSVPRKHAPKRPRPPQSERE